jgi:hypothetical protein
LGDHWQVRFVTKRIFDTLLLVTSISCVVCDAATAWVVIEATGPGTRFRRRKQPVTQRPTEKIFAGLIAGLSIKADLANRRGR